MFCGFRVTADVGSLLTHETPLHRWALCRRNWRPQLEYERQAIAVENIRSSRLVCRDVATLPNGPHAGICCQFSEARKPTAG
jgi:hypothetical protein